MTEELLLFPWYVRLVSLVQKQGNDGLTLAERRHLARCYAKKTDPRRMQPLRAVVVEES